MRRLLTGFFTLILLTAGLIVFLNFKSSWALAEAGLPYLKGCQALEDKNYPEALNAFKNALNGSVLTEEVLAQVGYTYAIQKDYQHALDYYWLAAERNPQNYTVQLSIARVAWAMGWHEDALENYDKLLRATPGNQPLMVEIADCYYILALRKASAASTHKAQELYLQGLDGQGMSPLRPWMRYAEMSYRAHNYDKAFSLYCQIIQDPHAPPEVIFSFSLTLRELNRPEEARQWMQIAAEEQSAVNPELANIWVNEALHLQTGAQSNNRNRDEDPLFHDLSDSQKSCLKSLEKSHRFEGLQSTQEKSLSKPNSADTK